jgi:threonine/homoserine/homoserine lactone efflux protein
VVSPKNVRTGWIWARAGRACATTNPAGWIFWRLFFATFFFPQKESKKKIKVLFINRVFDLIHYNDIQQQNDTHCLLLKNK